MVAALGLATNLLAFDTVSSPAIVLLNPQSSDMVISPGLRVTGYGMNLPFTNTNRDRATVNEPVDAKDKDKR